MNNKEVRAIRLTKDAVFEIVREYFMQNGNRVFSINKKASNTLYHFEEDKENGGYIVAVSAFDPSIDINELDSKDIKSIDSVYTNVKYSVLYYKTGNGSMS